MGNIEFAGFLYDDSGDAVNGATVNLYDRNSTTPNRANTTTNSSGYFTISHGTEGRFDLEFVSGSSKRRIKYDNAWQMQELEVANLLIRNPANTYKYDIIPAAITADRALTLPLILGPDTLPAIGLVQTWTADQTFADSVNITLGTGGDADLDYDGTDVVLDTAVVGTGQLHIRTNDNRTNSLDTVLTLRSITSGTPANGIGTAMGFEADSNNSGEGNMPVGTLAFGVTDMTNTAEDTEFAVHLRVAGAALEEKYNFRSTAASGYTGIFTHAASADRTWTLPNASDTLVGKATTDTLTNKTFDANGTGNGLSNVDVADLANGTDGELITWNASAAPATVAVGSDGEVLTSNGSGAAPTFQAAAGGPSQASQSAIEGETNENTYLPPDLLKHSPGVAKAWVQFNVAGTIASSYNVASVTDGGTGDFTVVIDTDFSNTNYAALASIQEFGVLLGVLLDTLAVGSIPLGVRNDADARTDPSLVFVAAFGDQ